LSKNTNPAKPGLPSPNKKLGSMLIWCRFVYESICDPCEQEMKAYRSLMQFWWLMTAQLLWLTCVL
jgi:hypothetical protein